MKTMIVLLLLTTPNLVAFGNSFFDDGEVTIVGTILASDWDDDGNATEITIEANGFEYEVAPNGKGRQLLEHVGETVRATGTVSEDEDGFKVILIENFEIETED